MHIARHAARMLRPLTVATLLAMLAAPIHAATYTYHGDLMDGDAPAQGAYDLRVRAFAHPGAAKALAEPTELPAVVLRDGRFSVDLDVPEDPDGTTWVEVAVRRSGSDDAYDVLGTPQPIAKANSTCPGAWALDGNSGMPAGSFLGIADAANTSPLVFKIADDVVATFTPRNGTDEGSAPSVAFGSLSNVASGVGATVGGGGASQQYGGTCPNCFNQATGMFDTVAGGYGQEATGGYGFVGGGYRNRANGTYSAVGGGANSGAYGTGAFMGGGVYNAASGDYSSVGGGYGSRSDGDNSVVGGGEGNIAQGNHSVAAGGSDNCAGGHGSWAGGSHAKTRTATGALLKGGPAGDACGGIPSGDADGDRGTFVWADSQSGDFVSSGDNQFLIRAAGGVGINTATFGNAVDLRMSELMIRNPDPGGNVDLTLINQTNRGYGIAVVPGSAGAAGEFYISETDARTASVGFYNRFRIDAAGTTFVVGGAVGNLSDARLKKNIAAIEHPLDTLLALQGQTFEYIDPAASMNAPGTRMGFVAQQVQQAIPSWVAPTGRDGYLAVTPVGFEALAVEAIRDLKTESDLRIEALERENAALRASLDTLTERMTRIEAAAARVR